MENSIHFDKEIVALTSLEVLLYCLKSVRNQGAYWQWVYVSLHSAVQAFMVLALTGSNSLLTYQKDDLDLWMENYENNEPPPPVKLDSYLNLYKKTKSNSMLLYSDSKKFTPINTQGSSIKSLNSLRNNFVHFQFDGSTIVLGEKPYQIVIDCLDFIKFLAYESNNVHWDNNFANAETERLLKECRALIMD